MVLHKNLPEIVNKYESSKTTLSRDVDSGFRPEDEDLQVRHLHRETVTFLDHGKAVADND
jgi:hypothetical protein